MNPRRGVAVAAAALALAGTAYGALPALGASTTQAAVGPGDQVFSNGAQCTANFVYTDGTNEYLGQAAHCTGTGGNTETDGCTAQSSGYDKTDITVTLPDGSQATGHLVYNSWLAMQQVNKEIAAGKLAKSFKPDSETCAYNDLALIKVDAPLDPTFPYWGGPTGQPAGSTGFGDAVYSYGNSELRLGLTPLSPKQGISLGDSPGGWSHTVYTVTPGIPGDSGSGFLTADGRPLGVLSTVAIAPLAGSNGVGDLGKELKWLNTVWLADHPGANGIAGPVSVVPGNNFSG